MTLVSENGSFSIDNLSLRMLHKNNGKSKNVIKTMEIYNDT